MVSYRRALAIQEQVLEPGHPQIASTANQLALLLQAQGQAEEAESLYRRALTIEEKALGQENPEVARTLFKLAELNHAQRRYEEAESFYERSLAILEKALGSDHFAVGKVVSAMAHHLYYQGRYDEVEPLFRRALAIVERSLPERDSQRSHHLEVATTLTPTWLCSIMHRAGRTKRSHSTSARSLSRGRFLGQTTPR